MKKFIARLMAFSMGPILGAVISFLTIPVTTYFIAPDEFGKASMITVVQSLILSLIYLGIDQAYTREYPREEDKNNLLKNAMLFPLIISIITLLFTIIFRKNVSILLFSSENYPMISILFGVVIVFSVIERFILLSIRMGERAVEYSLFSISLKLMTFILTLIFIISGERTFLTVVYSTLLGQIIIDIILIFKYKEYINLFDFKPDRILIRKLVIFGLPLIVSASLSSLLNTSGRFFLRGYSTYYELGIYTAALKISSILQIVQSAFTSFWVPTAYRWEKEKKDIKHFSFISDILLLVMTLGFFFILFFKKYIVLLLSSDYSEAQYVTGLLALTPILYTISETTTLGIVFSGKSYYNILVSLFSIIPNIILNFLLVPKYGTIGAGISVGFTYIIFCLMRTYYSRKAGFKISVFKQSVSIILFFIAACINTVSSDIVLLGTTVLFVITLLIQFTTVRTIKEIYQDPESWNFE